MAIPLLYSIEDKKMVLPKTLIIVIKWIIDVELLTYKAVHRLSDE
ncbi:hypothetical protein [Defluviitalea raffinosedens]|nr:hypothetical protein [Defluviitalea raffinosedens]MBM7686145.1 hypothetical protein [Defluviitalea raffinosedens]